MATPTAIVAYLALFALVGFLFLWVNLLVGWLVRRTGGSTNELRLLLATGFLGGFTTFSAFSLDFVLLWRESTPAIAIAYALASVLISLLAIMIGFWLMRSAA